MAQPKITLYVDTVSPFGYIAYHVLRNDPVFSKCDMTYVPIFLGGVMKACNNMAPLNIKNKDKWIDAERTRWASRFNVPMTKKVPEGFPNLTLLTMRALCALTVLHPGKGGQAVFTMTLDRLFEAYWVEHKKIYEKGALGEVLESVLGKEEAEKIMAMAGKEGKEILGKNTDQAVQDGAFGLPYFLATNSKDETEGIWGVDHLAIVAEHLGLEKPKTSGWKSML
ncbi:related to glutahione s-transferase subunit 13 [Rhynchosporium agropyri]|uniref:Glutathione S-transferase kappa n=1 Tax=Rhynchosporium agropyri TaxID=914238 RepID=A0A1E1JVH2_9HELO|nr:related to glutahione s-transferase subunit 13 [Rhynchosporium agropyri]